MCLSLRRRTSISQSTRWRRMEKGGGRKAAVGEGREVTLFAVCSAGINMSHLMCSNNFLPPLPLPSPSLPLSLSVPLPLFHSTCLYQLNSYAFPSIFFLLDCQMSITWLPAIVVVVFVVVGCVCLLFLLLKSFCGSHTHTHDAVIR